MGRATALGQFGGDGRQRRLDGRRDIAATDASAVTARRPARYALLHGILRPGPPASPEQPDQQRQHHQRERQGGDDHRGSSARRAARDQQDDGDQRSSTHQNQPLHLGRLGPAARPMMSITSEPELCGRDEEDANHEDGERRRRAAERQIGEEFEQRDRDIVGHCRRDRSGRDALIRGTARCCRTPSSRGR
ncbi:unnamed protein product [Acanthosepion pharaonis]|uniref:Uncharacterized protein n=1 Tax=Acanthosepion pharaonis TaxID=158019 RepID=A0A812DJQ3_ACAPH|nr:unnamed protein product [Sepia pharaonis]